MEGRSESQIDTDQAKADLTSAKDRLSEQAKQLSLKEYMIKHPYISLGAAFFSGLLIGDSGQVRSDVSRGLIDVISKEIIRQREQH